jgi:hypothetical protein
VSRPATYVLREPRDRAFAIRAVQLADLGMQVKISKPTRTGEQNRLLHALLADLSEQLVWPPNYGELRDLEWWKRTVTLTWLNEIKAMPDIIVDAYGDSSAILLPHTSDLTTEQCAALCEWIYPFGIEHGVIFKERQPEPPPSDEA